MTDYLIHIQYLGFRFSGWQRQPGVKTLESMLIKTLAFVLGKDRFKILGTSRTDAMVSASHCAFVLFAQAPWDSDWLLGALNQNLPPDIRALDIRLVDREFNIISSPRVKIYHYYFCHGQKAHPFCAPFLTAFPDGLDIELMAQGARLFEGHHDFGRYCTQPRPGTQVKREILSSRIGENFELTASFFPDQSWVYAVKAKGFMRNQVRLMMGQLVCLGKGDIGLEDVKRSLSGEPGPAFKTIAPASGLMLHKICFENACHAPGGAQSQ